MARTEYTDLRDDLDTAITALEAVIDHRHPRIHLKPELRRLQWVRRKVDQQIKAPADSGTGVGSTTPKSFEPSRR